MYVLSLHISPPHYLSQGATSASSKTPRFILDWDPGNKLSRPKQERRDIGIGRYGEMNWFVHRARPDMVCSQCSSMHSGVYNGGVWGRVGKPIDAILYLS